MTDNALPSPIARRGTRLFGYTELQANLSILWAYGSIGVAYRTAEAMRDLCRL